MVALLNHLDELFTFLANASVIIFILNVHNEVKVVDFSALCQCLHFLKLDATLDLVAMKVNQASRCKEKVTFLPEPESVLL